MSMMARKQLAVAKASARRLFSNHYLQDVRLVGLIEALTPCGRLLEREAGAAVLALLRSRTEIVDFEDHILYVIIVPDETSGRSDLACGPPCSLERTPCGCTLN